MVVGAATGDDAVVTRARTLIVSGAEPPPPKIQLPPGSEILFWPGPRTITAPEAEIVWLVGPARRC